MIYEYRCKACQRREEIVRSIKEHTDTIPCKCGEDMRQVIYAPRVIPDIQPYKSIVTGERIKGRRHHKEHLREHNLVELGNEPIRDRRPVEMPPVIPDLKQAINEVRK